MAEMRSEIYISDFIRIVQALEPDEDTLRDIIPMLGFELSDESSISAFDINNKGEKLSPPPLQHTNKLRPPNIRSENVADLSMEIIEEDSPIILKKLPNPIQYQSEENEPLPKYFPLLSPIWTRGIVVEILSTEINEGLPDMRELIELISHCKPITQIPYQSSSTIRRGAQVLIDAGPGSAPYMRDQTFLLEQIENIVGSDGVDTWDFIGTPIKYAVSYSDPNCSNYRLPPSGTPIIMLTDLGIAAPQFNPEVTTHSEWIEFAHFVRAERCPLLAFVPFNPNRWPNALKNHIAMIQWDYKTSILTIRKFMSAIQRNYHG
jgi:hypothetical protein